MIKCLIIIPAYNEAENIEPVVDNIIKELGPPGIISVDNITSPYIEANNFLEKEKDEALK